MRPPEDHHEANPSLPETEGRESPGTPLDETPIVTAELEASGSPDCPLAEQSATKGEVRGSELRVSHPDQSTFHCPHCRLAFNIFSSLTRHLKLKHPSLATKFCFCCSTCPAEFDSRRSVANHYAAKHAGAQQVTREGNHACQYCDEGFASARGLAQHIRGQHRAQRSSDLAKEAEARGTRYWTEAEQEQFVRALFEVGTVSNIEIAKRVLSRTAAQVNIHKHKFLKRYPRWQEEFASLSATTEVTPHTTATSSPLPPPAEVEEPRKPPPSSR